MTRLRASDAGAASAGLVLKEFRALALPFAATVVAIVGFSVVGINIIQLAIPAYYFGALSLGAFAIGHEYTYRTLAMLLTQPVSRARLLRAKLLVLVPMLLVVVAVAAIMLPFKRSDNVIVLLWVPPVAALCLAPWLTMVCRNVLAGVVFSGGLSAGLYALCELIAFAFYDETRAAANFRFGLYAMAATVLCPAGAILGLRRFLTLEVIEGRDAPLHLPRFRRHYAAAATRRNAVWMLVKKELHLQQMTLAVAVLYICTAALVWMFGRSPSNEVRAVFTIISVIYPLLLALLAGALSTAEERHLGTIEWQVMLPFRSALQWAIKVTVALTLALLLAVGLPSLFANVNPAQPRFVLPVLVVTSCAIYISSRASSGIHALLLSFVAIPVAVLLLGAIVDPFASSFEAAVAAAVVALALAVVALQRGLIHYRTTPSSSAR